MSRPLRKDEVPVGPCKVRALYSWSGESMRDLGFVEGDIIEVLSTGDGDWWTGKLLRNKTIGVFPRNFAVYVDQNQLTDSASKFRRSRQLNQAYSYVADPLVKPTISESLAELQIPDPLSQSQRSTTRTHKHQSSQDSGKKSFSMAPQTGLGLNNNSNKLNASQSSHASNLSTKSTEEILHDVTLELNGQFLDDIKIDAHPEDLRTPEFETEFDSDLWGKLDSNEPPIPPPHTCSLTSSRSSKHSKVSQSSPNNTFERPTDDLLKSMEDLKNSIDEYKPKIELSNPNNKLENKLENRVENKLDPKYGSEVENKNVSIEALRGPQIPKSKPQASSPETAIKPDVLAELDPVVTKPVAPGSPTLEEDVPFNAAKLEHTTYGDMAVRKTRSSKAAIAEEEERHPDTRSSFLKKLFPKNSMPHLNRAASRSSQKSASSTKSFKNRIKGMKSLLTFGKKNDDSYPSAAMPSTTMMSNVKPASKSFDVPRPRPAAASTVNTAAASSATTNAMSESLGGKWAQTRRDLFRARTLTSRDNLKRKQELELQGVHGDDLVKVLNQEASKQYEDYRLQDFSAVDEMVAKMSTWPELMSPAVFASNVIGRHSKNSIERLRAVFLVCSVKIEHVVQTAIDNNVMVSRRATHRELANTVKSMCNALDIECNVVRGHVRVCNEASESIKSVEHTWNAVTIDERCYFMDCVSAAADDNSDTLNMFYFLVPPFQLIYTHIPDQEKMQCISTPMSTAKAALLPVPSPAAFMHGILFNEFWLGMTRLSDIEVCELNLTVPDPEIDVVAYIGGYKGLRSSQALAQIYWDQNGRQTRVKAFVPSSEKHALLRLYAVNKQQPKRDPANMDLIWTVEVKLIEGQKNNAPYEFVNRFAAPQAFKNDLYIQEPQCKNLGGGSSYQFKIKHFGATASTKQPQVAVQSPSGRLNKLIPLGTDATDTFKADVNTLEVGSWRGVVMPEGQETWVPFSEWYCS